MHPCRTPRCPGLVSTPGYCDACRRQRGLVDRRSRTARWADWNTGTSTQRGYGATWRRRRAQVLRYEPLCRPCSLEGRAILATEVHHLVPRAHGGTDDLANLEPRCVDCHRAVTAAMTHRGAEK